MVVVVMVMLTVLLVLMTICQVQNPPPQQPIMPQPVQEIRCDIQDLNNELILLQKNTGYDLYKTQYLEAIMKHSSADSDNEYFVCAIQENNKYQYNESLFVHGRLPKEKIRNSSAEIIIDLHQGGATFPAVDGELAYSSMQ